VLAGQKSGEIFGLAPDQGGKILWRKKLGKGGIHFGMTVDGSMDGHLHAYDSKSGKVIWDFDTATHFSTLNGNKAFGGSMGGATGPVFNRDMVFVNSGYGIYFHMPGNVLLAFRLPEKVSVDKDL
jgi:outer membrane protein assembly factor BamB